MGGKRRNLWPVLLAAVIAVVTVAGLYAVSRSPHRKDLIDFWGFAVAVVVPAASLIAWSWRRARTKQDDRTLGLPQLDRLADLLAEAVRKQWEDAAGERDLLEPKPIPVRWQAPSEAMAGPIAAAIESTRFLPLPGLQAVTAQDLREGDISDLHGVYGGLGSGRLVIVGAPGSGKSGAAVLLVLAALHHRQSVPKKARPEVPVPVMFTLHGWDPNTQRARNWLAERLWRTYPLFAGKQGAGVARGMLDEGRIAVILDGLDEIPENLRPAVLRALNQQATFRLVLLTRSAEMANAAAQTLLQGAAAIELQDIGPGAAADYLTRTQLDPPPQGWHKLTSRLRQEPGSPLAQALNNPLMLTLVRDTYRAGDDIGELLGLRDAAGHPASSEDITGHLLDRVLPAAYTHQPGEPPPRYDLPTAERALRCIAARMNKDGIRDLQWWSIREWEPVAPRIIATGLAAGLIAGLVFGLTYGLPGGLTAGLGLGLGLGLGFGLGFGLAFALALGVAEVFSWRGVDNARPLSLLTSWRNDRRAYPLVVGLVLVLVFAIAPEPSPAGLIGSGLGFGLTVGLVAGFEGGSPERMAPVQWRQVFRPSLLASGLVAGLVAGLVFGLGAGLAAGLSYGLTYGLAGGLAVGLAVGVAGAFSRPGADNTSPLSPIKSWRSDRTRGLAVGLVLGLAVGLAFGLPLALAAGLQYGLANGLLVGLPVGLTAALTVPKTWSASLAFAQLSMRDQTSLRLMRFLEDARERGVLRTVGPVYQFRHARLQDRLAEQAVAPVPAGDPSKATAV